MKKTFITLACAVSLSLAPVVSTTAVIAQEATPQSNLYQSVNQEWLEQAQIPSDRPTVDAFSEMSDKIDDILREDVKKLASGELPADSPELQEFVKLYNLANDLERRKTEGVSPIQAELALVDSIQSVDDIATHFAEWTYKGIPLPFGVGVAADSTDSNKRMIGLGTAGTFLPDPSYYDNEAIKTQLLTLFAQSNVDLLKLMDFSEEDAKRIVDNAIQFDALLVPYALTSEQAHDVMALNNPRSLADVQAYAPELKLDQAIIELVGEVETVNVANVAAFENLSKIVNADTLPLLKDWMTLQIAMGAAPLLSDDMRIASGNFARTVMGVTEAQPADEFAYEISTGAFSEVIGVYYGKTYFGEAAREDVTSMVQSIIAVYKERLSKNDWLSEQTRELAIKKLDSMKFFVGYPETVPAHYADFKIDESVSLYENLSRITELQNKRTFAEFKEPVDKTAWGMPAHIVNAFYSPTTNAIYFPAGFLQAPFYSAEQSDSENYGGIGAVIAHEITHAFDTNGAKFDENGNLNDWWTAEDFAAFEAKAQLMVEQWDGLEVNGAKVNGQLTVTENIADAGGISASLEALKAKEDADIEAFFLSWARIWRQKATPEYVQLITATDPHAPNELRANIQPRNLDDFYEVFGVKEGDPMYLAPEKRISIW
ncbi:MAG: M13 family metallopeptidase [Aerococcaceae bacterium]|nr:M13 family metallopeptidase [Aerococcaceae bacterium]